MSESGNERDEKLGECAFHCENIMNMGRFGNKSGVQKNIIKI